MAAARLLDRLRGRSAGRAANGLERPGHGNEALTTCTKHVAARHLDWPVPGTDCGGLDPAGRLASQDASAGGSRGTAGSDGIDAGLN